MREMIDLDAVEPAPESEWAFPVNLVPTKAIGKGTTAWRFAIDYPNLNKITTTKSAGQARRQAAAEAAAKAAAEAAAKAAAA